MYSIDKLKKALANFTTWATANNNNNDKIDKFSENSLTEVKFYVFFKFHWRR